MFYGFVICFATRLSNKNYLGLLKLSNLLKEKVFHTIDSRKKNRSCNRKGSFGIKNKIFQNYLNNGKYHQSKSLCHVKSAQLISGKGYKERDTVILSDCQTTIVVHSVLMRFNRNIMAGSSFQLNFDWRYKGKYIAILSDSQTIIYALACYNMKSK